MEKHWWQEAVVYQVYPQSFQDTNQDGIGDLQGIRKRLGYIKRLGADVIWLNPIYASPNDDNGYDISDYDMIQPTFGTMSDFTSLLNEAHTMGLKIVMDLVVNHTSDEHAWFVESRKGKDNPYRDYYIWQDPVNGHEPNTWPSAFSGPAWEFDEASGQYYLHLFSKKQPDLNWKNTAVRNQVFTLMRRWLDRGIDGFRMDVINHISKPDDLTDSAASPINGPHVHEYLQEMNKKVLQQYDIMTVGEMGGTTPKDALQYAGFDTHELNMIFQFQHMNVDYDPDLGKWRPQPLQLQKLKQIMSQWQTELNGKAWNSLYWNNHDQPRIVSRFGNDNSQYWLLSAKMLGAVLHYQQGTPYIYQGEEIGMTNVKNFDSVSDYRDIETLNAYHDLVETRHILTHDEMMAAIRYSSRDNARTPMQWNASANAGFTDATTPWIKVNSNYQTINVAQQVNDPNSIFSFYQEMNKLRQQYPIITYGDYVLLDPDDSKSWIYQRHFEQQTLTLMANFTVETLKRSIPTTNGRLIQGNYSDDVKDTLRPYEVKVYLSTN